MEKRRKSRADLIVFLPRLDSTRRYQEIDETLQSKMSAEEEDAVQLELAAMVAEQEKARRAVSRLVLPSTRRRRLRVSRLTSSSFSFGTQGRTRSTYRRSRASFCTYAGAGGSSHARRGGGGGGARRRDEAKGSRLIFFRSHSISVRISVFSHSLVPPLVHFMP